MTLMVEITRGPLEGTGKVLAIRYKKELSFSQ